MNDTYLKKGFISILMVLFISLHFFGCSNKEESSRQMLNKVLTLQQAGKYDEAKKTIQDIIRNYPETEIAVELRDVVLVSKEEIERSNRLPQQNKKLLNQPQPLSPQEQKTSHQSLAEPRESKVHKIRNSAVQFIGKLRGRPTN